MWLTLPPRPRRFYVMDKTKLLFCLQEQMIYDEDFQRVDDIRWHFLDMRTDRRVVLSSGDEIRRLKDVADTRQIQIDMALDAINQLLNSK
jgi:hypothetical protein